MKTRRAFVRTCGSAVLWLGLGERGRAQAREVIKLATLAPAASPWGQVFKVWAAAVSQKSGGRLELQIFFNGQQGDEGAVVGKLKAGSVDGAALTAVGLSKLYKPILGLQMPGLFRTWAKLDAARDACKAEFERGLQDAGVSLIGWGDVGIVRRMSKGFAVRSPEDFKGKKPLLWRDDSMQPVFYQVVGGVTPVPLSTAEVLPNLNTGAINIVDAPSLAAEQLQWSSKLDTLDDDVVAMSIGAVVISAKRIESLPADLRAILLDTGKVATNALTRRIRDEDAAAFARLKSKMTVVTQSAEEKAKFEAVYKQTRQRLGQGTFSAELVAKLEGLAR